MADFSEIHIYLKKIEGFLTKEVPDIIGTEAVNHFTENFDDQSYDGKPWEELIQIDNSIDTTDKLLHHFFFHQGLQ